MGKGKEEMFDGKSYFSHTTLTDKGFFYELSFINGSSVPFFFFRQSLWHLVAETS